MTLEDCVSAQIVNAAKGDNLDYNVSSGLDQRCSPMSTRDYEVKRKVYIEMLELEKAFIENDKYVHVYEALYDLFEPREVVPTANYARAAIKAMEEYEPPKLKWVVDKDNYPMRLAMDTD